MFVEVHSARHQAFKVTECTSTHIGNLTIISCTQKAMYRNVSSYRIASIRIHHQLRIELYRSEFNYMSNKTNSKALNVEASKRYCNRGEIICMGFFDKVIANNWAFEWSNLNTRLSRVTYFIAHSFASARASASSSSHFPASCQYLWRGTQQLLSKCIYMKRNIMLGHSTYNFFCDEPQFIKKLFMNISS